MMKKYAVLFFGIFFLIGLVACGNGQSSQINQIRPMELTSDQQELLELITNTNREIVLFDVIAQDFESVEIWIEKYSYGVLVENMGGLRMFAGNDASFTDMSGTMVIFIDRDDWNTTRWTLQFNGGSIRHITQTNDDNPPAGRGAGGLSIPAYITEGEAIIIYSDIRTHGSLSTADHLIHPEELPQYPYVYIIKAMFSR